MPPRRSRPSPVDRELAALDAALGDRAAAIAAALGSSHARVVVRAAEIARAESIDGVARDIADAYLRLVPRGVDGDPGCRAKSCLLDTLDALGWRDEEPFLSATRFVQREPAFGPPYYVDTATAVRARGALALMRQGYRDLPLIAAELLDDPEAPVRAAAADALGAHGLRDAAGPLIGKIAHGDDDPTVTIASFTALLALVPEWTLAMMKRGSCAGRAIDRELASVALGTSRREDALDLLIDWLSEPTASIRETMLTAIGLHRSERALAILIEWLKEGSEADAVAAIRGLRARRFDSGVVSRARTAASERSAKIQRAVREELDTE